MRIKVWDLPVRLFHAGLALAFFGNAVLTKPGKELHQWVGYAVVALLAFRLVWGLVGSRHARFADFPPDPRAALGQVGDMALGRRHVHAGHSPLGALMIYNLLVTLALLGLSGYATTTVAYFGVHWVKEVHEALATWAEVSVVLHILAAVAESRRLGLNLPKSMVTGYKNLPDLTR